VLDRRAHGGALVGFEVALDLADHGQRGQRVRSDGVFQLAIEFLSG
jgi:hypothetical protein